METISVWILFRFPGVWLLKLSAFTGSLVLYTYSNNKPDRSSKIGSLSELVLWPVCGQKDFCLSALNPNVLPMGVSQGVSDT